MGSLVMYLVQFKSSYDPFSISKSETNQINFQDIAKESGDTLDRNEASNNDKEGAGSK